MTEFIALFALAVCLSVGVYKGAKKINKDETEDYKWGGGKQL